MANSFTVSDIITQITKSIIDDNIILQYTDDSEIKSNIISIKNKSLVNFGSCSYLGLEFDDRLKNSSKAMIDKYGTQFSESRSYVSIHAYKQLEEKLENLFEANVVVTPTTTLGHFSNLPVLINPVTDAIIVDHQVHNSIQMAVQMLKGSGCYTELLRHNRMDYLEERIIVLKQKYKNIWYMADGVYSMFGDKAPLKELEKMMNTYEQFRLYIDDAHGMSVYGKNGSGYVLSQIKLHPQMVLGTSLNKAFASGGGVMVYPTKEMAQKVRLCGGPMITSGPIQPAMIGAAIASANIHLSNEIIDLQQDLQDNIRFATLLLSKTELPVVSKTGSPVFFIGVSLPKVGFSLVRKMVRAGFYVNIGLFPAVPIKNTGIRFTITRLHTFKQIEDLINTLLINWKETLKEECISIEQVYNAFKMQLPEEIVIDKKVASVINQSLSLKVYKYKTIKNIKKDIWNNLFNGKGNYDYEGMLHIEKTLKDTYTGLMKTDLDYIIVTNYIGELVLATFTTCSLQKDDMFSPTEVSEYIETIRVKNPEYLTSKVLQIGSVFTEGELLYINYNNEHYKDALIVLFEEMTNLQEKYNANSIVLRDFVNVNNQMEEFFIKNGFFKIKVPDTHYIDLTKWSNEEEFIKNLNSTNRYHFKKDIKNFESNFEIEIKNNLSNSELRKYYELYLNVKKRNLILNVFEIPFSFFENMFNTPDSSWEAILLYIKIDNKKELTSVTFAYSTDKTYCPLLIGINYKYLNSYKIYKQSLYQMIKRAKNKAKSIMNLGFGASLEKRKLSAIKEDVYVFLQIKDNFNLSIISELEEQVAKDKFRIDIKNCN